MVYGSTIYYAFVILGQMLRATQIFCEGVCIVTKCWEMSQGPATAFCPSKSGCVCQTMQAERQDSKKHF